MNRLLDGLKAVAEPTRLRILSLCAHAELSVSDLTQILGQSQPRVSRHLKLLTEAGLLDRFREGPFAFYRLAGDGASAALAASLADLVPLDDPLAQRDLDRLAAIKAERAQAAADYFRANAGRWDVIRRMHVADSEVEQALLASLPTGPLGDVVDLGTGTGRMLELVAGRASRLVGIDRSREMLALARAKLERANATRLAGASRRRARLAACRRELRRRPHAPGSALPQGSRGSAGRGRAGAAAGRSSHRGGLRPSRGRGAARRARSHLARLCGSGGGDLAAPGPA